MGRAKKPKQSNKIAIYLRVSTEEQSKSGLGIEAQEQLCRQACDRFGLEVLGIYKELGISGKVPPLSRPEFIKAVADAQKAGGKIMVAKLDRLSRNLHQATGFLDGVYDCPEIMIAESPGASMLELRLKALIAQEERDMISARTKAALAAKKAQGFELGKVGRAVAHNKARESTEAAVNRALELRKQGYGWQKIANILNEENFVTSRGSQWSKQSVYKRLAMIS